jgi:Txe/YoeB family toxin of Txe-Axe toxin-antitoxin module
MNIKFSAKAFDNYNDWMVENGKVFKKVIETLKELIKMTFDALVLISRVKYSPDIRFSLHPSLFPTRKPVARSPPK